MPPPPFLQCEPLLRSASAAMPTTSARAAGTATEKARTISIRRRISAASLRCGKGLSGSSTPRNSHSGPQPQLGSAGHAESPDLTFTHGFPADAPGRRIEPHGFFDHHVSVTQPRQVFQSGRATFEHVVKLRQQLAVDFNVLAEEVEGPGKGDGGGLVAS